MPKKKLEYLEHLSLGNDVRSTRDALNAITLKVINNTPKTGPAANAARRLLDAFGRLRLELDNSVARDYPERELFGIYYGNNGQAYKETNHA